MRRKQFLALLLTGALLLSNVSVVNAETEQSVDSANQTVEAQEEETEEVKEETVPEETEEIKTEEADKEATEEVVTEETTEGEEESVEGKVLIPDAAFRQALEDEGIEVSEEGYVNKADMETLESLYIYGDEAVKAEFDLTGIEAAENLTNFYIQSFVVKHTEKLENLTKLTTLIMPRCELTNIDFVKKLPLLEYLGVQENQLTDISALKDLELLETLDLGENQITDFTTVFELAEKNKRFHVNYNDNPEEGMRQIFEKGSYKNQQLLEGQKVLVYFIEPMVGNFNWNYEITLESKDSAIAEIDSRYVIAKKAGTTEVVAKYAGSELKFNVVVEAPEKPVAEEDKVSEEERVQDVKGKSALKNGAIWNWENGQSKKISGEEKIKNYVAHIVYRGTDTPDKEYEVEEYFGLSESGTLWNWKKNDVSDKEYTKVKVADHVREIVSDDLYAIETLGGYITEDNVYHVSNWWRERTNWEFVEVGTIPDVSYINYVPQDRQTWAIKTDGKTSVCFDIEDGKLVTQDIPFAIKKKVTPYDQDPVALDNEGNLWSMSEEDGKYVCEKLGVSGVSDISRMGYLKDSVYYTYEGEVIAENLETLDDSYIKDGTLYTTGEGGKKEIAKNVKQYMIDWGSVFYIDNNNDLYYMRLDREDKPQLILTSVLKFIQVYGISSSSELLACREDGSGWVFSKHNDFAPYKAFSADQMKEEQPVEPEEPSEPEQPEEPENPSEPEKPVEPEKPGKPEKPEEPEVPAQPQFPTISDSTTGVSISGDVEEGTVVKVENVAVEVEEEITALLEKTLGKDVIKLQKTFDISMLKDGVEIQPDGSVTVRIPLPSEFSTNVKVFWTEDGKIQDMGCTVENGKVVFNTTHFSLYTIVDLGAKANVENPTETETENDTDIPKTGDTATAAPFMAAALAALGVCLVFARKRVNR